MALFSLVETDTEIKEDGDCITKLLKSENHDDCIYHFQNAIEEGHKFGACLTEKGEFFATSFLAMEFPCSWPLHAALQNEFIKRFASFIVDLNVPNPDERHFIVIFCLNMPITNRDHCQKVLNCLGCILPEASLHDNTPEKIFVNSSASSIYQVGGKLPDEIINYIINDECANSKECFNLK